MVEHNRSAAIGGPAELFRRQVGANLRYWRRCVAERCEDCCTLDGEDENLARAIWLALQLPDLARRAIALLADSRDFVLRRGDLAAWTDLVDHLVDHVLLERDQEYVPEALAAYELAAELYERRALSEQAERCYRRALELCAERPLDDAHALALANWGWFLVRSDRSAESAPFLEQALLAGRELSNQLVQARALLALGAHYIRQEDSAGALACLTAARPVVEQLGKPNYLGRLWIDLGTVRWQLGELKSAQACFKLALAYFGKSGDISLQAGVQVQMGLLYVEREDYREALQQFQAAEAIYQRVGNLAELARVYNSLGTAYWGLQVWEEAEYYYQKAVAQWGLLDHELFQAQSQLNLAECYLDQQKSPQAAAALRQVRQTASGRNSRAWAHLLEHLEVLQARLHARYLDLAQTD